jgi:hypothetical protein
MLSAEVRDLTIIDKVIEIANEVSGLDVKANCREDNYVTIRMACYKILRDYGFTYDQIATKFNKNHATVLHSARNFEVLEKQNKKIRLYYRLVLEKLTMLPDNIYLDKMYERNFLGYLQELDDLKEKVNVLTNRLKYYEEFEQEIGGVLHDFKKLYRTNQSFSQKFDAFWSINKKYYLTNNN